MSFLLAFIIAAFVVWLELITANYPRTSFLLARQSWALYAYIIVYGLISGFTMLGLEWLTENQVIEIQSPSISHWWVQALIVGISTKALLHIRLFSVNVGTQSFPIGVETIVQLFEPWLLRTIELDEFNAVRGFIESYQHQGMSLEDVKTLIKQNLPPRLEGAEKSAFKADLNDAQEISEAMELYLRSFGKKSFIRIFDRGSGE